MKKITLLLAFMSTFWAYSQVSSYSFTQSAGTYTEISGTQLTDAATQSGRRFVNDPTAPSGSTGIVRGPGYDIGFNFTFNGVVYNRFGLTSDGWISLGQSALQTGTTFAVDMTSDDVQSPLTTKSLASMPNDLVARISALGSALMTQTDATLSYTTSGTAPNRVLVVQWKNYRKSGATGDSFNFQIRLYETTNIVNIVYGPFTANTTESKFQVGLRAAPLTTVSNFLNRTSATDWNATAQGFLASDAVSMTNLRTPASGLTYSWVPPVCGGASDLSATVIGATGATLTWNSNLPAPAGGYEYIVSTSAAFPVVSGTATSSTTVTVASLSPNTVYYVFLRSKCGSVFTPWSNAGTFKTKCSDATTFLENFDSYSAGTTTSPILPTCWESTGAGEVNVSITNPASGTKSLYMRATSIAASYAIMPPVSNLGAATHRLRFKATANVAGKTLEIGYFPNPDDLSAFTSLGIVTVDAPTAAGNVLAEYSITPPALSGVKNLVFKNAVATGSSSIYIDDVIWEPIPPCLDVTGLVRGNSLSNSVTFRWVKSASGENAWQYVYGPAETTTNPDSLTPIDVSGNPNAAVSVLQPQTAYKIWVRSKCGATSVGSWIGPLVATTTCVSATQFVENFDASTSLPSCWTNMGGATTVSVAADPRAPSTPNVLNIFGTAASMATVVLPPLSNAGAGTNRLRFRAKATVAGAKMDIGYYTDMSDLNTYVYMQTVTITSTTSFNNYIVSLGTDPKSIYLALRSAGNPSSNNIYLDEVVWEPTPTCADITALASTSVSSTTATIGWTPGGSESAWQYVFGDPTTKDPATLAPVNASSSTVTIPGLSPATTYKVWVRSKCSSTSLGAWFGPVVFSTSCASDTAFSQNFDASAAIPSCWTKVGAGGAVSVSNAAVFSSPNALSLNGTNIGAAIVAMPPVSNAGDGTYRLRFKARAASVSTKLEVGYLTNFADPASFAPIYSYVATQNTSFETKIAQLGMDPSTDYLAFRVAGTSVFYVDDVIWEPIPPCADISNLATATVASTTASIIWTAGASEKAWQYVKGDPTVTDPNSLVPVNVSTNSNATITGLTAATSYKVWVRSNCGSGQLGAWSYPITFKTTCIGVSEFAENFDAFSPLPYTSLPDCWTNLSSGGTASIVNAALSYPYQPLPSPSLLLYTQYPYHSLLFAMKPLNNAGAGTHRLRFKYNSNRQGLKFDVGYLKNPVDASSFEVLATITTKAALFLSTTFETIRINDIGAKPDVNQLLAFRMPTGGTGAEIYIDDLVWEPLPACADVSQINVASSTANSATIQWSSAGSETQWQISVRPVSATAPDASSALTANVTKSLVVPGLNPSSTYKVWVRSVCGTSNGDWIGPVTLYTQCTIGTALNENFNVAPDYPQLPTCWGKIMRNADPASFVLVQGSTDLNVTLMAQYTGATGDVILVSPRLSNLSSGTLKFVGSGGVPVEVGTLSNSTDTAVFTKIQEVALKGDSTSNVVVNFSNNTTDQYIGIRVKTGGSNQYATLDNITWDASTPILANDQFDLSQFSYYPNPVTDVLNISFNQEIDNVSVVNLLGQQVISMSLNAYQGKIDMSGLSKGAYLVKVTAGNQSKTIKVIKE